LTDTIKVQQSTLKRRRGDRVMRRREFITLLGAAAAGWPLAARAQPAMPVIGVLYGVSAVERTEHMAAFRRGLAEIGFVEGRNVAIDYRWAEGQYDRMAWMAVDLVGRRACRLDARCLKRDTKLSASETDPGIPHPSHGALSLRPYFGVSFYAAPLPAARVVNWVHGTAAYGFLQAYHIYVQPLSSSERDRYYAP
jgi:hypothetical protein